MHARALARVALLLFAAGSVTPAYPRSLAVVTVYSDSTFASADWETLDMANLCEGGSVTAWQVVEGGNPGAFRYVSHSISAPISSCPSVAWRFHRCTGATFDAGRQGAILSLDWSCDFREIVPFGPGAKMDFGPAIRQDGQIFYVPLWGANTSWESRGMTGLTPFSFSPLTGTGWPNFTVSGGPIELGFWSGNSNLIPGMIFRNEAGFDNWRVTLHLDASITAGRGSWGQLKTLYR